jgi:hypothetical protein
MCPHFTQHTTKFLRFLATVLESIVIDISKTAICCRRRQSRSFVYVVRSFFGLSPYLTAKSLSLLSRQITESYYKYIYYYYKYKSYIKSLIFLLVLNKTENFRHIVKIPNIKFHENPSRGRRDFPCGQMDGPDETNSRFRNCFSKAR